MTVSGMCSAEKSSGTCFGQELRAEFLRIEPRRRRNPPAKRSASLPARALHQPAPHLAAIMRERDHVVADVLAAHAGRIGGADQGADRGAGDGGGP